MNTLRSTLVTSAILLAGLVAAGHILYPSDAASEAAVRKVMTERLEQIAAETRAAEAKAAAPSDTKAAWIDPPTHPEERAPAQPAKLAAAAPDAALQVAEPAAAPTRLTADAAKKAEQVRRRKLAQAAARARKAKEPAGTADVAYQAQPAPAQQRIDPIGDILRGLGIGRQG